MGKRPAFRTRTIAFRVTDADFDCLRSLAEASQQPLGEWCRDVVLEFAGQPTGTPAEQALLAEVIGLRTIVANLIFTFTSGSAVTADVMAGIVERADRTKVQRAMELLRQLRIGPGQEPHAEKR